MKILDVQVLRGPNYWSNYRKKLIVLTLDLGPYEYLPSNQLKGFNVALKGLLPSMLEHRCSIGCVGGFFERLEQGTWLGHVLEHVALELQCLAGIDCGFGRTFGTGKTGVYFVIFEFEIEKAGLYAGNFAFELVHSLARGEVYLDLEKNLKHLRELYEEEKLGPSTKALVLEAQKRKIPVKRIGNSSLIRLGQACRQKILCASLASSSSAVAVDIAANKELTKNLLLANFIPTPKGLVLETPEALDAAIQALGFPLVIKPLNGNHGRGILTNINSMEKALLGFQLAKEVSDKIIVEQCVSGEDYRLLVVNYQLVAAAKRTPASVIGTGTHTIQELIQMTNDDPKRGQAHGNVLTAIEIDEISLSMMKEKNLNLESILPKNECICLKATANLSTGGTAKDVTDSVHPMNVELAERIARIIGLDICGIDVVASSISEPINARNGAVIEVNAGPGLRMHLHPTEGKARNVAAPILDMLYPDPQTASVPVVAVTGTNGKTTVVRLIAHLAKNEQFKVGFTTTEGIYIQDKLIYAGDCSGPQSAEAVLGNPEIDFAVLECARGGILHSGLGFDECDISIITNVSGDHLGLEAIETLDELARVKAVVAFSTKQSGYTILNAEDERLMALRPELKCKLALFGLQKTSLIKAHCALGGLACFIVANKIVLCEGSQEKTVASLEDIPLTFQGSASCMIQNLLPAVLAGFISGFGLDNIRDALCEFLPIPENLPGRMNIFNLDNYKLMVDYAHNEGAFIELKQYFSQMKNKRKIGIIGAVGDRRDEDIQKIGYYSAQIFDEIIIKHDKDSRGSSNERLTSLIKEGILNSDMKPKIEVITDEFEAVEYAMKNSCEKTFIFYAPENVFKALEFIETVQRKST